MRDGVKWCVLKGNWEGKSFGVKECGPEKGRNGMEGG